MTDFWKRQAEELKAKQEKWLATHDVAKERERCARIAESAKHPEIAARIRAGES